MRAALYPAFIATTMVVAVTVAIRHRTRLAILQRDYWRSRRRHGSQLFWSLDWSTESAGRTRTLP